MKAAENGDVDAMSTVGWCFDNGDGVTQDTIMAFEWYLKSAENGCAVAMFNVGWCYES